MPGPPSRCHFGLLGDKICGPENKLLLGVSLVINYIVAPIRTMTRMNRLCNISQ
jgi:hypothetical protein